MIRRFALLLSVMSLAAVLQADVTPTDAKNGAEAKRKTVEKNVRQAGEKATEDRSGDAAPAPRKRRSFFDSSELSKDRSLPADDKVPMTDDKPRKRKSLSEQLHKDRSQE